MTKRGMLTIVSGFSGAGKGTVIKELLNKYKNYALSISATTRQPRIGEHNGVNYFFLTTEEFERMIEKDEFLEYEKYVNCSYGTPKNFVTDRLESGYDVILEIEVRGAMCVKEKYPDALLVFLTPPCVEELRNRLYNRGTETKEVIEKRLTKAKEEADVMHLYDYVIINDVLDTCVEQMHQVIQNQKCRVENQLPFINKLKEEIISL